MMITSNRQCNFFRLHFTNEYKFVRYLLLCLFVYLFFSIFASVSLLQEGNMMNISWRENYYENDHDYYEHLLEGNITLTMCKFSFHFPSNLLGIMKFGWDGWVAKALNSCPLYSKGSLLWHIDSRPQATGSTPRLT